MFIATIDCDIEGKIARRFVHDVIDRKIDKSNAIKIEDLVKLNVCQVHRNTINKKIAEYFIGMAGKKVKRRNCIHTNS